MKSLSRIARIGLFVVTIILLLTLFNIYYLSPKFLLVAQRIKQGEMGAWLDKKEDAKYFVKIREVGIKELLHPYIDPETRMNSYKLQKIGFGWPTALLSDALEVSNENFTDQISLKNMIKFYGKYIDPNGNFISPNILGYIDSSMHGNTLIYLEQITGDQKYRDIVEDIYAFLYTYPRSKTGVLPYRKNKPNLILVDTLGMICPFLARYGKIYNHPEATELAEHQMVDFINNGTNLETGLPYHGYISGRRGYVGILGWGRGIGWYLYGLVGTMEYLPSDSNARKIMLSALNKLTETLECYQRDDGTWSSSVIDPYDYSEMSGTAMIGYSIEKAIGLGLLSKKYYKMCDRAFIAIKHLTTKKGFVLGASGESGGPGKYSSGYRHYSWVQGPTIAFTALLLKRKLSQKN